MRRSRFSFLLSLLAVGCVAPASMASPPATTQNAVPCCRNGSQPSFTLLPSPESATLTPSPIAPTAIATQCEWTASDYCLEDGLFVFALPVAGQDVWADPTYRYGSTQGKTRVPHHGVEFPAAFGAPVLAAADGIVWYAGDDRQTLFAPWPNFYGNVVILEHPFSGAPYPRLYTLYAHLSRVDVRAGQAVNAGDTLGLVGMSGSATGSHLHFEVRLEAGNYTSTINPELYLRPPAGRGALAVRLINQEGQFLSITPTLQFYPLTEEGNAFSLDVESYAIETINPQSRWQENIGLGNLPAGRYRITFIYWGKLYERWGIIEDGKLTLMQQQVE